jgi:hypothetical protein
MFLSRAYEVRRAATAERKGEDMMGEFGTEGDCGAFGVRGSPKCWRICERTLSTERLLLPLILSMLDMPTNVLTSNSATGRMMAKTVSLKSELLLVLLCGVVAMGSGVGRRFG